HSRDARHGQCRICIDGADIGMGQRRPHDLGIELMHEVEIIKKAAAPRQQPGILPPPYRLADRKLAHAAFPRRRAVRAHSDWKESELRSSFSDLRMSFSENRYPLFRDMLQRFARADAPA